MTASAFDQVRVRYILFAWLGLMFHVPGVDWILSKTGFDLPDYWWNLTYQLAGQGYFVLAVVVFGFLLGRVPLRECVGRYPTRNEISGGLELSAFLFVSALATDYLTFFPLSFIAPGFVEWWYIDLPDLIIYDGIRYPVLPNLVTLFSVCVVAPVFEEIAFRGIILPRFARKWGLRAGILGSSAIFGVAHPDTFAAFLFGIGMCILYLRSQSLLLPMLCHTLYNLVAWLTSFGYDIVLGPYFVYTLEDFQAWWPLGAVCGVVTACWVLLYFRRPRSDVRLALPVA